MHDDTPIFVISVAAELAGMHPQTLRQYDRLGLVSPGRTRGRGRRYSLRDVATLREVQRLSHDEGVNLAGIKRILALEAGRQHETGLREGRHILRRMHREVDALVDERFFDLLGEETLAADFGQRPVLDAVTRGLDDHDLDHVLAGAQCRGEA